MHSKSSYSKHADTWLVTVEVMLPVWDEGTRCENTSKNKPQIPCIICHETTA